MRRGITPVVAIVLLLMMTVAAGGGAYAWMSQVQDAAEDETADALATEVSVRDLRCDDADVSVTLKNTGDAEIPRDSLDAFLYQDDALIGATTVDISGAAVRQPTGLSTLSLPFVLTPGQGYTVELAADDTLVRRSCRARAASTVGHWDFETRDPGTVRDIARGNDGTFENNEVDAAISAFDFDGGDGWADGWRGGALAFDAAAGYARTDAPLDYQGAMTMLVRIRPNTSDPAWDSSPSRRNIFQDDVIDFDQKVNNNIAITIEGVVVGDVNDNTYDYPEAEWSLAGFRYDGSTLELVRDGAVIDSASLGSLPAPTTDGWLGSETGGGRYWAGRMDEFLVYDRALTDAELSAVNATGETVRNGLIAEWTFDEGSGTTVHDTGKWLDGQVGEYALRFDGINDQVVTPDTSWLNMQDELTISFWVRNRGDGSGSYPKIVHKSGNDQWQVHSNPSGEGFTFNIDIDGSLNQVSESGAFPAGEWVHGVATYDGQEQRVYVNGTLAASRSVSGTIGTTTAALRFGAAGGSAYNGTIDDVRILETALEPGQVSALYNATR